jgi:hypothetical protein
VEQDLCRDKSGLDVNAHCGYLGIALQIASLSDDHNITELLLNNSADINASGGEYKNALQATL